MNTIVQSDSLDFLKTLGEHSNDIMYCDPPYALGSEVIVRPDGKVDYAKASDFMGKWEMPTGDYWEQWFKEAFRTLKYGGHLVMFGMDRQLLLFKYYGHLAGFTEKQSMYWYFISNFPKATDLSKMIDKNAGAEREKIENPLAKKQTGQSGTTGLNDKSAVNFIEPNPSTELAKKYNGYKYSIAPLKQTNETILVFQKPYKTGSCLHDTLAYENGDTDCTCGALDIGGNRVGFISKEDYEESTNKNQHKDFGTKPMTGNNCYGDFSMVQPKNYAPDGRYPAQTFCDDGAVEVLGDVNKVLHKCNFEEGEHDLYIYQPKVSKAERNTGLDGFEEKIQFADGLSRDINKKNSGNETPKSKNNHPTLKPIALNEKVLRLFKTPGEQVICYPFAGAGSEIIGGIKAGFKNWNACEISEEYIEIAEARIKHWEGK